MGPSDWKRLLSGDYTDKGFARGVQQALDSTAKSSKPLRDIAPANLFFRTDAALDTYHKGLSQGYEAGLRKRNGIYETETGSCSGQGKMMGYSYESQLRMIDQAVAQLEHLRNVLEATKVKYGEAINAAERSGMESAHIAGLRERESRLTSTMESISATLGRHMQRLDRDHRTEIEMLRRSAED